MPLDLGILEIPTPTAIFDGETMRFSLAVDPQNAKGALPPLNHFLERFDAIAAAFKPNDPGEPPALKRRKIGRYVYFLIESMRDVPARAHTAGEMARRGFQVVMGHYDPMSSLRFGDLPPGIMVGNGLSKSDSRAYWQSGCAGHLNVAVNDNILFNDEAATKANINRHAVTLADFILAPFPSNALPAKAKSVGYPNARFSLGKTDGLILVCASAGMINSSQGFERCVMHSLDQLGSLDGIPHQRQQIIREHEQFSLAIDCYIAMHEKFGDRVELRPHPSELPSLYLLNGITINQALSLQNALSEAACVVYPQGSSAGLEAQLAGVPAVCMAEPETIAGLVERQLGNAQNVSLTTESCTLADELESIWETNQYAMPFDVERAWAARDFEYRPDNKFPDISNSQVESFTNHPVKRLAWNVWALKPHAN